MRLTLRTLLAYRDRVLNHNDAEDLHRRINKSESAGNLLRRIDSVSCNSELIAPPPTGQGLGADPNTVSEYLDDAMAAGDVPEFEKTCLVSDVHLAELAQCHSLLSDALSNKIAVPQELHDAALRVGVPGERPQIADEILARRGLLKKNRKRRSRRHRVDSAHKSPEVVAVVSPVRSGDADGREVQVQAPMVASGGGSIKQEGLDLEGSALHHEVPEYLMGSNRARWGIPAAIAVLALVLALLVWQTLGPWERVANLFVASKTADNPVEIQGPAAGSPAAKIDTGEPTNSSLPTNANHAEDPKVENAGAENDDSANLTRVQPDADSRIAAGSQGPVMTDTGSPEPSGNADPNAGNSTEVKPPDLEAELPPPSAPLDAVIWSPEPETEMGSVLFAKSADGLELLAPGQPVDAGIEVVVLPIEPATVTLPGGVKWIARGASVFSATVPQPRGLPVVKSSLFRAVVQPIENGQRIALETPVGKYTLAMATAQTRFSIELSYRPIELGSYWNRDAVAPVLVLIVLDGQVSMTAIDGSTHTLDLGQGLAVVSDAKPRVFGVGSIPPWLRDNYSRPVDQLASQDMAQALAANKDSSAAETLASLAKHRRPETAALAVQASLLCGTWQPYATGFLSDGRMRAHWSRTIRFARQVLAAVPAEGAQLETALKGRYGEGAGTYLFKLTSGLPKDELDGDGLSKLIRELESGQLENRVLACYQLSEATGEDFGYQPHVPNPTAVQAWRRENSMKRLSLVAPRDPIWERQR